ncbi:MAG: hypothetical protein A4E56_00396 [Pelotomaculum sp. PtaU1.Bin065]|nr:MAG: hypothetical protein A4E56_00396 [Pelotomaculum sp. PtaU1.Bin065]
MIPFVIPDEPGINPKLVEIRRRKRIRQLLKEWPAVEEEFLRLFNSGFAVGYEVDNAIWSEANENTDGPDTFGKDKESLTVNFQPEVAADGDGVITAEKEDENNPGANAGNESNQKNTHGGDIFKNEIYIGSSCKRDSYGNTESNLLTPVLFRNPTHGDHCPSVKLPDKRIGPFTVTSKISPSGLRHWERYDSCYYCDSRYRREAVWDLIIYGILWLCMLQPAALMSFTQAIVISIWPKSIEYPFLKKCELIFFVTAFIASGIIVVIIDIILFRSYVWYLSIVLITLFTLITFVFFLWTARITGEYNPANIQDYCEKIKRHVATTK